MEDANNGKGREVNVNNNDKNANNNDKTSGIKALKI
jgi:hypothetical protein